MMLQILQQILHDGKYVNKYVNVHNNNQYVIIIEKSVFF